MLNNKLSAVIITYNEEKNIERCLDSLKEVADEIIVVDSFSTDKTPSICNRRGVIFYQNPFEGHIEQKNYALSKASFDYIISLDADEALGPKLREEIIKLKKEGLTHNGYSFNRLTHYVNQWIYHCGWYPDKKLRLIKKDTAKWGGTNPHDILQMRDNSPTIHLSGDLLHYSYNSISEHITQTNKFTTISAQALYNSGKRASLIQIVTRGPFKFFRDYIIKRGFLDGRYGFVICLINALSVTLKYAKLKDLQEGKQIT